MSVVAFADCPAEAVAGIADGAAAMIGEFGTSGNRWTGSKGGEKT